MEIHADNAALPPFLKLGLPEIIYAVPGIECNLYFENVLDSAVYRNYTCEVRCDRGTQGEHRWFWTPEKSDAGAEFILELSVINDYGKLLSGKCKVLVASEAADPERKFTLSLLADSGVGCRYPDHILKVMQEYGFINYTPVGSHSGGGKMAAPGEAMHDGYGGFSWKCFLNRWWYSVEELPEVQNEAEAEQMRSLGARAIFTAFSISDWSPRRLPRSMMNHMGSMACPGLSRRPSMQSTNSLSVPKCSTMRPSSGR